MGRLYDAYVEVGPRFAGFGDIKAQGDKAGREYGKALAEAAAKAAAANVRRLGEALAKARSGEADAAGKVRIAEQKLAEVRAQSNVKLSQITAAEEALAAAQRKSAAASGTAKSAAEALEKGREQAARAADDVGKNTGGRFTRALRGAMSKSDKDGAQVATRFGVGFNGIIGGIVSRSAGVFAAGFAAVKAGGFLKDAIASASDLGETMSKSAAVFGPANGQILKFAKTADTSLGQTQEQAIAAASQFGNMFNQLGIGQKPAAQMSTQMVKLASDFASFHNADISTVLEAQSAAFRGEYDSIQQFVPTINAAAVEQEGLRLKLAGSTKELTDQDKAIAVQSLLLKGAGKATGDFARTSGGLANQQRILSAQFGNFKASLGAVAIPLATKFFTFLNTKGAPALKLVSYGVQGFGSALRGEGVTSDGFVGVMERIGVVARSAFGVFKTEVLPRLKDFGVFVAGVAVPAVKDLIVAFTPLARDIGQGAVAAFQKLGPALQSLGGLLSGTIVPAIKSFTGFLRDNQTLVGAVAVGVGAMVLAFKGYQLTIVAVSAVTKAWAAVQLAFNVIMAANPIGIIALALVGLAAGLVYAYKHSEKFRDIVNGAFTAVKDVAVTVFDAVKSAVSTVIGFVSDHWKLIVGIIGGPFIAIVLLVTTYWDQIKAAFSTAVSAVLSALSTAWGAVVGVVSGPMNVLIGVVQAVWSRIMPILVLPFYIARTVIGGIWTAIEAGFNAAVGFVQGAFATAWNVVQAIVIAPLDKAWHAIVYTWSLIQAGFTVAKDWVVTSFSKAWSAVAGVLTGPVTTAKTWIGNRFSDITGAFTSAKNWVLDTFAKAWADVKDKLTKPVSDAKGAITTALGAGKNGLQWVFSQAVSGIGKIWDGLQELAKAPIRLIVNTVLNDGLIDGFNWVANQFKAPQIPRIPLPKGFAEGGRIPGAPSMRDNLVARGPGGEPIGLATGEFITNAKDTARALPVLEHINRGGTIAGFADGGLFGKLKDGITGAFNAGKQLGGDVLGFLKDPVAWFKDRLAGPLQKMDQLGDSPAANIIKTVPKNLIDSVVGKAKDLLGFGGNNPGLAGALGWAKSQEGKNYGFGDVGPDSYDCSGFLSAIVNFIQGRPLFQRRFATGSLPAGLFDPGPGAFSIGWRTGNPGHTAGTLNGTHVESRGGEGVVVGSRARGADDSLFTSGVWHLKGFDKGGRVGDPPFDLLNKRGKHFDGDLAAALGVKTFDTGLRAGKWAPGTLAYNGTGKGETVRTAEQEADLKRPLMLNARIFIGTREITDIVRVEIDENNRQAANSFNL